MAGVLGALKASVVGVRGDGRAVLVVEGLGRRPPLAHRCDDDVVLHSIPKVHSSSQPYRNLQRPPFTIMHPADAAAAHCGPLAGS